MKATEKLDRAFASLRSMTDFSPRVALVLGSGLGGFAERMEVVQTIDYGKIEGFPTSSVSGHAGRLILGYVSGVATAAMQGRVHYYEGNAMTDVVLPIRTLRLLGAETLILTNAAGGINEDFACGDLMLIRDHISSFVPSPLIGENFDSLGTRFPDMSAVYDKELSKAALRIAEAKGISLREGVYLQVTGPQYETPAEIKMFRALGADAVGMSTACEAIAARHAGYRTCGISLITNAAVGRNGKPLTHEEVEENANRATERISELVRGLIASLKEDPS